MPAPREPSAVFIVAEAGVNHNGSLDMALQLVEAAAHAGADAVKFQTFRASELATESAPKAGYQAARTGADETQFAMLKRLELDADAHRRLLAASRKHRIEFMSTAFDEQSLELLVGLGVARLKCSSGDLTNGPYLLALARTGLPVILSTGMATLGDVENALCVLAYGYTRSAEPRGFEDMGAAYRSAEGKDALQRQVTVLHCTSAYPAPPSSANLRAMTRMARAFGLKVGYSDHTEGGHIAVAAAALGAAVIEKHFTLDRSLPGPDHSVSLEPAELKAMVRQVRDVTAALGTGVKEPADIERENMIAGRRSIVAACAIRAGEPLAGRLAARRPAGALSPMQWWEAQQRTANRDYARNESIDESVLAGK